MSKKQRRQRPGADGTVVPGDLKIADVAASMRASPSTVYREIQRGRLPAYRLGNPNGNGPLRVEQSSLDNYKLLRKVVASAGSRQIPQKIKTSESYKKAIDILRQLGAWEVPS